MSTFDDLAAYVAVRRCAGLALSPDGTRLVTTVSELAADKKTYTTSLWAIDPAGADAPRRLTRSGAGESSALFTPDGDLLFTSRRADPADADATDDRAGLWRLPAAGGEAEPVVEPAGGVSSFGVADDTGTVFVTTPVPQDTDAAALRDARETAGVSARLHTAFPVRFWDHDLGPGRPHLQRLEPDGALTDLAPTADDRLDGLAISPDGRTVAVVLSRPDPAEHPASLRRRLELHHADGTRTVVADEPGHDHESPEFTPDGRWLLWIRERHIRPGRGPAHTLRARSLPDGGEHDVVAQGRWLIRQLAGGPDGVAYVAVDEQGRGPVHRVSIEDGTTTRLTRSNTYTDVVVARDGRTLYALATAYDSPPTPVRLDPAASDQEPLGLRGVTELDPLPGTLTEVEATADDGTALRSWLVLPGGASSARPAPLVLWIHGGPLSSWNAWSWRWNPWLLAARGYAVLLPDPRLSTGYGQEFLDAATGAWGELPFTDLMTLTDAALERGDLDASRTAAMGGSFGGYMANWVAGHTDRFDAIVTHASLWAFDQFAGTTDFAPYWQSIFTPEAAVENSPHRFVRDIRTPMLVIHGDRDYRVPIGEGLRLWADLNEHHAVEDGTSPHRFLYYPDENHWILSPQNARVWYETVFAFLEENLPARSS